GHSSEIDCTKNSRDYNELHIPFQNRLGKACVVFSKPLDDFGPWPVVFFCQVGDDANHNFSRLNL
ncbi:MAG: hypothetical protein O6703_06845, partial [Gammaproteobacteria bacterium]|nr:hypothetical protein [Gammaproteobacteria bacterium]